MPKPVRRVNGEPGNPTGKESRPAKVLPTNRVAFQNQLDVLRAFGAASEPNGRAVQNVEISRIVNLHQATVGFVTPFLTDAGLLQRTAEGLVPVGEVVEFSRAHKWSPDTASHRLASVISRTWFANVLMPKLRFNALQEADAVQELALAASAGPSYKGQIDTLLDYMQAAGIVARENGQVRLTRSVGAQSQNAPISAAEPESNEGRHQSDGGRHAPLATSFVHSAAGVVQFNISVKVDMAEFAAWQPDRISAFFAGVAQVLAAKGAVEEDSSTI